MTGRAALADAAATAALVGLLLVPIAGLETVRQGAGLALAPHPWLVVEIAAAAFLARFAWLSRTAPAWRLPSFRIPHGLVLTCGAALLALPIAAGPRVVDLATTILTYVMLGWGLNIVVGLAGLLDLGYVAFYAVGAYTAALLGTRGDWGFWQSLPLAGLCAAAFGLALGLPILRLRGDYLAIVTLGFGEIVRIVLVNWASLTGGPNGIGDIPRPTLPGVHLVRTGRQLFFYGVILALAAATGLAARRLRRLPVGRAWEALREDEIACRSLGINPVPVKLSAFATGAFVAGIAGAFFAGRQGFVSPDSFTFSESAMILAIVVLGGMGSEAGVALAAVILIGAPELFRDFAQYRMVVFGAGMVAMMALRPQGLVPGRRPTVRLGP